jgi:hypothetical protein
MPTKANMLPLGWGVKGVIAKRLAHPVKGSM